MTLLTNVSFFNNYIGSYLMITQSKDIKTLEFPSNVRARYNMYLGPIETIFEVSFREIINNSIDEYLKGVCSAIYVTITDAGFTIRDHGAGIPIDDHESGKPTLEVIFGQLHSGRNFVSKTHYSTGLNGVGASCVNAVSKVFKCTTFRDKKKRSVTYEKGIHKNTTKITSSKEPSGVEINVEFDFDLFDKEFYNKDNLTNLTKEIAKISKATIYLNEDGKFSKLTYVPPKDTLIVSSTYNDIKLDVELLFTPNNETVINSYCNTINTLDGGTHVTGFKRAYTTALSKVIVDKKLSKYEFTSDDLDVGYLAIVSVYVYEPKYTSQLKSKLTNSEVNGAVFSILSTELYQKFLDNLKIIKPLIKLMEAKYEQRNDKPLISKKDKNSVLSSINLISKYSSCVLDDSSKTELWICEGESAASSIKDARDKQFQAVYALKGKLLNTFEMDKKSILKNEEVSDLFKIILKDDGSCRFDKLVFATDKDADGGHIVLLLLTFIHTHFKWLLDNGNIYIANSPLYRASNNGKYTYFNDKKSLNQFYQKQLSTVFKDLDKKSVINVLKYYDIINTLAKTYDVLPETLDTIVNHLDSLESKKVKDGIILHGYIDNVEYVYIKIKTYETFKKDILELKKLYVKSYNEINSTMYNIIKKYKIIRFKGLGECNSEELEHLTVNPKTRTITHIQSSNDLDMGLYMGGNKHITKRKEFIIDEFKSLVLEDLDY